ncbi:P-loop ATPase, Sll1717 family [Methylobacterium indicum]|uniref:P-loop ATPase, Sll1717 family n=1 Tax=Methylobacterium indicum TaxID=1775910 RepID=UPI002435A0EA|nr:hypothetical protein [Methylobacterium indicum]
MAKHKEKASRPSNPLVVRPGMSIGSISAERDDEFLFECFVDHPAVAACKSVRSPGMVIAGRTGAGKTAVIRYIEDTSNNSIVIDPSDMALNYVSNSDVLRFIQSIGGDIDLLFLALWKHVLCIEFIRLRYKVTDEAKSRTAFSKLVDNFRLDQRKRKSLNYLREWEGRFWITMDENIKEITQRYEGKLAAELGAEVQKFKAGGQYEKRLSNERKSELVARAKKIINSDQLSDLGGVIEMLSDQAKDDYGEKYFILIDRLDERWVDVSIRFKLIRALIESLKAFRKINNLKIVVALRADILERVVQETGDLTFQREKLEEFFVRLRWTRGQLRDFVDKRLALTFRRQYSSSRPVCFDDIFTNKVGTSDPFEYILERTLMRPRDVLVFVNECLNQSEGNTNITAGAIRKAEGEYSRIRRQAIEEEWQSAFPSLPRLLDYLQSFKSVTIEFKDLCEKDPVMELALPFTEKRWNYDPIYEEATKLYSVGGDPIDFMKEALGILYRVGAIGIKPAPGERYYFSHRDDPVYNTAVLDVKARITIHMMLHRALGIEGRRDL